MLRGGDKPYSQQPEYQAMLAMKADIYVVLLGTNDTKPHNWSQKKEFKPSALALLEAIFNANPASKIFLCLPIPAFPANFEITDDVIRAEVIPLLREVAEEKHLEIVDLYSVLEGRGKFVPDKVHPNAAGYKLISKAVAGAILRGV
jgi:lysophospholipase L1-like esterase